MTDTAEAQAPIQPDINIRIARPKRSIDWVTVIGLAGTFGVIAMAIFLGEGNAKFLDIRSTLIVVFGTLFVTSTSYSWAELTQVGPIIAKSIFQRDYKPSANAKQLMDLAMIARKNGLLALSGIERELRKDAHLAQAVQIVTDGYTGEDVARILSQDLDSLMERHRRAASILRRGAEVAPAMGLIGTLVGLVLMLAQLQDPESIGPSMALALLTTLYGAVIGTGVLAPLAAKLERNSNQESLIRSLVMSTMISIAGQENPRRLEMILNAELPPEHRIRYFD